MARFKYYFMFQFGFYSQPVYTKGCGLLLLLVSGVTTDEIDRICHEASVDRECCPSPLNYYKFPKPCCTSVNEVICHGIPDKRPLQNGDICNVDVTVYHRGFHGDLNETIFCGDVPEKAKSLVINTWECLEKAIETVKPGTKYRDVGNVIQKHVASAGYSVVRSYCGHGIHKLFHCAPNVPHYAKNKAIGGMKEFEQTMIVSDTGVDVQTRQETHALLYGVMMMILLKHFNEHSSI